MINRHYSIIIIIIKLHARYIFYSSRNIVASTLINSDIIKIYGSTITNSGFLHGKILPYRECSPHGARINVSPPDISKVRTEKALLATRRERLRLRESIDRASVI